MQIWNLHFWKWNFWIWKFRKLNFWKWKFLKLKFYKFENYRKLQKITNYKENYIRKKNYRKYNRKINFSVIWFFWINCKTFVFYILIIHLIILTLNKRNIVNQIFPKKISFHQLLTSISRKKTLSLKKTQIISEPQKKWSA